GVARRGLDPDLDDGSGALSGGSGDGRRAPTAGHPQFAMQALLKRIGIARASVIPLAPSAGRARLASEAFRPAATTDLWQARGTDPSFAAGGEGGLREISGIETGQPPKEGPALPNALPPILYTPPATPPPVTPPPA